ncbi:L-threonylcarbamoyladenylate synthase [Spirochaetia bacterium 38H-sp]|uniref:Threonylcarbamoyl-AMP synthase n=1 Tax=Rarispira pelagica TaxID=3141764 RepID=A0ABU9UC71_9SPIR
METLILDVSSSSIRRAAGVLRSGGLVAFPTETVYGLGANALDASAVARIFEAKERPFFDPLIVHVSDFDMAESVVTYFPPIARRLAERFWPGPLTIVLPRADKVPSIVTSGLSTVGVRMPAHTVAREIIRAAGVPVAAPSANLFGRLSPTKASHVIEQLDGRIGIVLDGGHTTVGVESTVVRVTDEEVVLLRPGGLAIEDIESFLHMRLTKKTDFSAHNKADAPDMPKSVSTSTHGKNVSYFTCSKDVSSSDRERSASESPGELEWHYAPVVPLVLLEELAFEKGSFPREALSPDAGVLAFRRVPEAACGVCRVLSTAGNMSEAAVRLFDALHELENAGVSVIFAESVPEEGLGRAVMDRLRKAAARFKKT